MKLLSKKLRTCFHLKAIVIFDRMLVSIYCMAYTTFVFIVYFYLLYLSLVFYFEFCGYFENTLIAYPQKNMCDVRQIKDFSRVIIIIALPTIVIQSGKLDINS